MKDLITYRNLLVIHETGGKNYVFDDLRKKKVILTPEEMVRQMFIKFLLNEQFIPPKHIAVERQINIKGKAHRFDILIFGRGGNPRIIVECKSFKVKLSESVAMQISKYNLALNAEFLCITNGNQTLIYKVDFKNQTIDRIEEFPEL